MKKNILDIENQYQDQECVIVGCGPSLAEFTEKDLHNICKNKVVLSIKQGYHRVPFCHYHFLNDNNYETYTYSSNVPDIVVECPSNHRVHYLDSIANYFFIVQQNWDFSQALSRTLDFDRWTIKNSPFYRPFGPGIMFETVLFFAYHIGVSKIYTIGWDGGPSGSTKRDHYYGQRSLINPANDLFPDESKYEIECSKQFYLWLKKNGVELNIASHKSFMSTVIPRAKLV